MNNGDFGYEPPKTYRTKAEADALLPEARAILEEVAGRLPPEKFHVSAGTLFVSTQHPDQVAIFALSLPGVRFALTAVPIYLGYDFELTVQQIVNAAWRWRDKTEAEIVPGSRPRPTPPHPFLKETPGDTGG